MLFSIPTMKVARLLGFLIALTLLVARLASAQGIESDLTVVVSDGVDTTAPDTDVTDQVTVTNLGPDDGRYTLTCPIPAGLTFVSLTRTSGPAPTSTNTPAPGSGGTVTISGDLPAGASATFDVVQHVPQATPDGTSFAFVATVTNPDGTDHSDENDRASDSFSVAVPGARTADFAVSFPHTEGAPPNSDVVFHFTVANNGPDVAQYSFDCTLTGNLTFVSLVPTGGTNLTPTTPGVGNGGVVNATGTVANGQSATFDITAHVPLGTPAGTSYTIPVSVSSVDGRDNLPDNDRASDTFVVSSGDLSVLANDGRATAVPGQDVTYDVTASNAGPDGSDYVLEAASGTTMTFVSATQVSGPAATLTAPAPGQTGSVFATGRFNSGESAVFTLVFKVLSSATGTLSFTPTITPQNSVDSNTANNSATDTDTLSPSADLVVTLTDGSITATPGTNVTYRLTAANSGPSDTTYTFSVPLPVSSTFVSFVQVSGATASATTPGVGSAGTVSISGGLGAGTSAGFDVTLRIASAATGSFALTATGTTGATDPSSANNAATDTDTLAPSADLAVSLTDSSATAIPGTDVTYRLTAANSGPSDTTYTFSVPLPVSSTFVGFVQQSGATATATNPSPGAGGTISIAGVLATAASATFDVTLRIASAATGSFAFTATGTTGATDPSSANNTSTDTDTLAPSADLAVSLTDSSATAIPGTDVTYRLTAANSGPSDTTYTFSVPLPVSSTFVGFVQQSGATATATNPSPGAGGTISIAGVLATAASATFDVTLRIASAATGGFAFTATGTTGATDPSSANNTSTDTDTLAPSADLAVSLTDSSATAVPGTNVTYRLTAANAGPSDTTYTFSVPLPVSSTFVGFVQQSGATATATNPSPGAGGTIAIAGVLATAASATFDVTLRIASAATGSFALTATGTTGATDPSSANNTSTDTDTLAPSADLAVSLTDSSATAVPGTNVTYRLTATNNGPSDTTSTFSLPLPVSSTFVSFVQQSGATATATNPSPGAGGTISISGGLAAAASATFDVTLRIASAATGSFVFTATGATGATDPNPANNSSTDTDTLTPRADLAVVFSGPNYLVTNQANVRYTATVTNNGPSDGSYSVSCPTPAGLVFGPASNLTGSLPAGQSASSDITVSVAALPPPRVLFTAAVSTNSAIPDPNGSNDSLTLTINIPQFDIVSTVAPTLVGTGQIGRTVSVTIRNDSVGDALVITGTTLHFGLGDSGYTVRSPATIPPLAAGTTQTMTYSVDVGSPALGTTSITWTGVVTTAVGAHPASLTGTADGSWTVVKTAALAVGALTFRSPSVLRGSGVSADLSATNTGGETLNVSGVSLVFSDPKVTATVSPTVPFPLAGGASITLTFDVAAALTATVGPASANATLTGAGASTGVSVSGSAAGSLTVKNNPPTAVAPAPQSGVERNPFSLNGGSSFDGPTAAQSEGDGLVYNWSLVTKPPSSSLTIASFSTNGSGLTALTQITPDRKGPYVIGLTVFDGRDSSSRADTTLTVVNSPPVASVAPVPSTTARDPARLDGTGSSDRDVEDTLTYSWSILSAPPGVPPGSIAISPNGSAAAGRASSLPPAAGTYSAQLVVNDGTADSSPTQVTITVSPRVPPIAVIRAQSTAGGPQVIDLDGGSSRAFGTGVPIVSYSWNLMTLPAGATPFTSSTQRVLYPASRAGSYVFTLTVTDSAGVTGSANFSIDITDVPPVADAGRSQTINLPSPATPRGTGTTSELQLDGRLSSDANGDTLSFSWSIVRAPDRSSGAADTTTLVSFDSRTSATPRLRFRTDLVSSGPDSSRPAGAGSYAVRLTVTSRFAVGVDQSRFAEIQVNALAADVLLAVASAGFPGLYQVQFLPGGGIAPTVPDPTVTPPADALGQPLNLRAFVRLDGRGSVDPQGLPLAYRWTVALGLDSKPLVPAGSAVAALAESLSPTPTFVPDRPGFYTFQLIVNNGVFDSAPSRVTLQIAGQTRAPFAAPLVEDLVLLRQAGPLDAGLVFITGDRVVLNGTDSAAFDPATPLLAYSWTQTRGPSVALSPSSTAPSPSFLPSQPGRYGFQLIVTDSNGLSSAPVEVQFLVLAPEQPVPRFSIASSATTSVATGADLGDKVPEGLPPSLRVTLPTTVTLAVTPANLPPGQHYTLTWRQLEGSTVLLTNSADTNTTAAVSRTSFSPTTAGALVFEANLALTDTAGTPTGVSVSRLIAVLVDSSTGRVPVADAQAFPSSVGQSASEAGRRVMLSGVDPGAAGAQAAGRAVTYLWVQIGGPPAVIANPSSAVTSVTLPAFTDGRTRVYRFALIVSEGSLRSLATVRTVTQQGVALQPALGGGASSGGGGCALWREAASGSAADGWLILLLPLAGIAVDRRRRPPQGVSSTAS